MIEIMLIGRVPLNLKLFRTMEGIGTKNTSRYMIRHNRNVG